MIYKFNSPQEMTDFINDQNISKDRAFVIYRDNNANCWKLSIPKMNEQPMFKFDDDVYNNTHISDIKENYVINQARSQMTNEYPYEHSSEILKNTNDLHNSVDSAIYKLICFGHGSNSVIEHIYSFKDKIENINPLNNLDFNMYVYNPDDSHIYYNIEDSENLGSKLVNPPTKQVGCDIINGLKNVKCGNQTSTPLLSLLSNKLSRINNEAFFLHSNNNKFTYDSDMHNKKISIKLNELKNNSYI